MAERITSNFFWCVQYLKIFKRVNLSVSLLLDKIAASDGQLEASLCTRLQSVRGTKQYWFLRPSELRCMIRNIGPPTLFLTFSCVEYESTDIMDYLQKANNVPFTYNIGKLCIEDTLSVSRQFSLKFYDLFKTVLIKGSLLGEIDHFYWKKAVFQELQKTDLTSENNFNDNFIDTFFQDGHRIFKIFVSMILGLLMLFLISMTMKGYRGS